MAMVGLMLAHPFDPRCGGIEIERWAERRHDLGVAANPLKGCDIFVTPRPHDEPFALDHAPSSRAAWSA